MVAPHGHKRREFSQRVKGLALKRCMRDGKPHCENCGTELNARIGTIFEHIVPDGLGGEPTLENCGVWCFTCADIKTVSEDNPRMAKADRVARAHFGIKVSKGPPMPGSKKSGWKRKMNGQVVRR